MRGMETEGGGSLGGEGGRPAALGAGRAAEAFRGIVELLVTEAAPPVDMAGCSARMLAAAEDALDAAGT